MRKEYGVIIRKEIVKRFTNLEVPFNEFKEKNKYIAPGEKVFYRVEGNIFLFIIFVPQPSGRDSFTFEIGWSTLGRFPELGMRPSLENPDLNHSEFKNTEYVCRLPFLIGKKDYWWTIPKGTDGISYEVAIDPEKAAIDATIVLDESWTILMNNGLTYLQDFCSRRTGALNKTV